MASLRADNCGIYSITSPSGKQYIGSSSNLQKRWTQHKYRLRVNKHANRHLQNAWNKYEGKLEFKPLVICRPEDLLFYEQLLLDNFKPEYNISKYADISLNALGVKRTEETKAKISQALKGKSRKGHPHTEESKAKLRLQLIGNQNGLGNKANLGKKLPQEVCDKMSASKKGIPMSEDQKKFLSESRKGSNNPMFGRTPWNKKNVQA